MGIPPGKIDYTDPNSLRRNEALLLSAHCLNQVEHGPSAPLSDDCAEERVCMDDKGLLEGLQLILDGCAALENPMQCTDQALKARQAEIAACVEQRRTKYHTAAQRAAATRQRIDTLVDRARYALRDTPPPGPDSVDPAWRTDTDPWIREYAQRIERRYKLHESAVAFSTQYHEGLRALRSPECDETNQMSAYNERYGISMLVYTQEQLAENCDAEERNIHIFFEQGFIQCLASHLDPSHLYDPAVPTQCLGGAAQFTADNLWAVPQFQLLWKKFYYGTKLFGDKRRTEIDTTIATLESQRDKAAGQHREREVRELDEMLANVRTTATEHPIPVVDVDTELAAHRERVQQGAKAFSAKVQQARP